MSTTEESVPAKKKSAWDQVEVGIIIEGGLLTHAMEAHYCDCVIEGGLLTHAMQAHYCDCIIEGGLLTHALCIALLLQ